MCDIPHPKDDTLSEQQNIAVALIRREDIFAAMKESGFVRTKSCCDLDLGKMCEGDEYKGQLEAFVMALMRIQRNNIKR